MPTVGDTAGLYYHAKQNASIPGGRRGFAVCQRQRLHGEVSFTAHHHHHWLVQRRMRRKTTSRRKRRKGEGMGEGEKEGEKEGLCTQPF